MKSNILIAASLLATSTLAIADSETYSYPRADALPQDDTANFLRDPALLTGFDLNLSAERFAKAWLSKTNERERIKADMYLLGVVDASEGIAWCKGKPFLPNTLHEYLHARFANLSKQEGELRASKVITDGMQELRPCKRENNK